MNPTIQARFIPRRAAGHQFNVILAPNPLINQLLPVLPFARLDVRIRLNFPLETHNEANNS